MEFTLKTTIQGTAQDIYSSWLSSEGHTKMTGGEAVISDKPEDEFTAWDGYISGENISLDPNHKIKQLWRTSDFEESDIDSIVEITLKETGGETELTLVHSELSESGEQYKQGWEEHYFKPMKLYFSN
jgi:activator of HSP90 ATPase